MSLVVRLLGVLMFAAVFSISAQPASADGYQVPVQGNVTDVFRPPATPYGAGNRGWEFDTTPGANVNAANDGTVTFAGQVGGVLNVVVRHADGLVTTYARLQSIRVVVGQLLSAGDALGTSGSDTYFGVRENGQYIDPASLFDGEPYLVSSAPTVGATSSASGAGPTQQTSTADGPITQAQLDWLAAKAPAYWPAVRAQMVQLHL